MFFQLFIFPCDYSIWKRFFKNLSSCPYIYYLVFILSMQQLQALPSHSICRFWECTKNQSHRASLSPTGTHMHIHTHTHPHPHRDPIKITSTSKKHAPGKIAVEKLCFSGSIAGFVTSDRSRIESRHPLKKHWENGRDALDPPTPIKSCRFEFNI